MKRCSRCNRELDESQFYKNKNSADGLQIWCKDCMRETSKSRYYMLREEHLMKKEMEEGGGNIHKIYTNNELAKFTPRELMEELKARGYTGELRYVQTIKL